MGEESTEEAIALATRWARRASLLMTKEEKQRGHQLTRLMANPVDKVTLTQLIDQSFRSQDHRRVADQIASILASKGIPSFFSLLEKSLLTLFMAAGRHLPSISVPRIVANMRETSTHLIIPGETGALDAYLQKCRREGLRVNINHIGEAVLGEEEAKHQLTAYLDDLKNPAVEYVSIKISTIFSQLQPLAFEQSVSVLSARLSELYRAAARQPYTTAEGRQIPKFVNLDMEAYRDLEMTAAAFMGTLGQPEFRQTFAGMALQAYLPDSFALLKKITRWARKRVADGGSPIKIRIVKGANMEMERLESSIYDWPLAPFDDKAETDANYKRMVSYGLKPENSAAVRLGVASHNLFDLAYAYLTARKNETSRYFSFEMLAGMADHLRRALQETGQEIVVYAPVARKDQFINAVAYLIRRLDENTGPQNFLRHASSLEPGTRAWRQLAGRFRASIAKMNSLSAAAHRQQNRLTEKWPLRMGTYHEDQFGNSANTDWSLEANRTWAESIRAKWCQTDSSQPLDIPLVIGGEEISRKRRKKTFTDPSRMPAKIKLGAFALANASDVNKAVAVAKADPDRWRDKSAAARHRVLSTVARELRMARADLIGAAAANTGKLFTESDVEVSEAIDFAEYYPFAARQFERNSAAAGKSAGVGVVISPWNFPVAIPCGGIVASLAAGNTVIFKPSSEAVLVAWILSRCFWRAGVSKNTLQFLPCSGSGSGARLTRHPDVDFVILTGGTDTALSILSQRPDVLLAAETGGKNATIVTAMADRDQAIDHVIYAAFGNSGQKCSATSLLILEDEVFHDPAFKKHLVDAAGSLPTGSAWDFANRVGPLVHPPGKDLKRALTTLESGESWALKPLPMPDNPHLWTPGIKWNAQPGGTTHMTEFFGPILGVMHARDLDHAIELVNQTGYGLTSGLESLDIREHEIWKEKVHAGNLYINRGTTGAVTLRQPFGGMGKSAIGAGLKAGGPDYVTQFMRFDEKRPPAAGPIKTPSALLDWSRDMQPKLSRTEYENQAADIGKSIRAINSYLYHRDHTFSAETDFFHLPGQDNLLRYLPLGKVVVRLHADDTLFELIARIAAAKITGNRLWISIPRNLDNMATQFIESASGRRLIGNSPVFHEDDAQLIKSIPDIDRIRYASPDRVPAAVFSAAAKTGFYIARSPVLMEGRIELLHYLRQQSICNEYHRYGNLGERSDKKLCY